MLGSSMPWFAQREHDAVWFGERGFLSSQRAVAFLPTGMCVGSGVLAAALGSFFPRHVDHLAIPMRFHEMLALPLSLLLAFRFQGAYDRWWKCRNSFSDLIGRTVAIAEYIASHVPAADPEELKDLEPEKREAEMEAQQIRKRFMAILEAYLVFIEERVHGPNFKPHPSNTVKDWPRGEDVLRELSEEDAEACLAGGEPIVWCSTQMLSCIHRLQELDIIDGDNGSMISSAVMQLEQVFIECMVVVVQDSPAPFIVHYRTIMIVFCFSFPFALINHVTPMLMVPLHSMITFAFLGSEYCSREMEHPFGSDEGDIPVRKIIAGGRSRIRQAGLVCP